VQLYRFSTGTAEFVICRNCGVYIGAIGKTASGTAPSSTRLASMTARSSPTNRRRPIMAARRPKTVLRVVAANSTPATIHR